MAKRFFIKLFKVLAVAAFWIFVWYIAARHIGKELLLPAPSTVFVRLCEIASTKDFYVTTAYSLLRISCGIIIATVVGIILSVLSHVSSVIKMLTRPLMTVIKATPVASFIILALVWIDRGSLPIFIALLMVLPVVWTNLCEGLNQIDYGLLQLARVYNVGFFRRISGIYIPSVLPYFTSAVKTSMGLAWKAGIAAEVLAVPARSIGKELFNSKTYFETTDLFAWTIVVIVLSLVIELVFEALISLGRRRSSAKNK